MKDLKRETEINNLVLRAQKGDEESFEKLFHLFFEKIAKYVSLKVSTEDREDLTGEIFLKVVQKLNTYKKQKNASFSSWIFCIARNCIIDFYRKNKFTVSLQEENDEGETIEKDIEDTSPLPSEITEQKLNSQKIKKILNILPPIQKEVIELKFLEDFNNEEIAQITGKSEGNIRIIQMRALQTLRTEWEKQEKTN